MKGRTLINSFHSQKYAVCLTLLIAASLMVCLGGANGCYSDVQTTPVVLFGNTTDPTNGGAGYIGSPSCHTCHSSLCDTACAHGHNHALMRITNGAPTYNAKGTRAGVPNPPDGYSWDQISYVIGGYTLGAYFVDANGYVMTDGVAGVNTKWLLDKPATGTTKGFAAHMASATDPTPYAYDCFRCHVVNPMDDGGHQRDLVGIEGTWEEAGVRCEVCHGPGALHAADPFARELYVDSSSDACKSCHTGDATDPTKIAAADGFIVGNHQWSELRASGGHSNFSCMACHDPHVSVAYDRDLAIRNNCTACHAEQNMARHQGLTFVRGDYEETLSCESCHMPFAGKNLSNAPASIVGNSGGRQGDVRTHIYRINTDNVNYTAMFNGGGTELLLDDDGLAAVTLDFVCLRCHNGIGNAFPLTVQGVSLIAPDMHDR